MLIQVAKPQYSSRGVAKPKELTTPLAKYCRFFVILAVARGRSIVFRVISGGVRCETPLGLEWEAFLNAQVGEHVVLSKNTALLENALFVLGRFTRNQ